MTSSPATSLLRCVLAAGLFGCTSDASEAVGNDHEAAHVHPGDSDSMDMEDDFKGCPESIPAFEPGLLAKGKHFAVKVLSSMPTEPERYTNNWQVELDTLDGSAAADARIEKSQTFMPIHGHDGMVVPEITALASPGQFSVDRLTFTMRGAWEARFWLRGAGVDEDYIVLHVCVAK